MGEQAAVLLGRKDHSLSFLGQVRQTIGAKAAVASQSDLCVYTAGSYGRLEAWPSSDLDLFIVHDDLDGPPLPFLTAIRVQAALADCFSELNLQPPSNDGEFLKVHSLNTMLDVLGSPKDDSENLFTSRLLLLLEGRPLYNDDLFERVRDRVIDHYLRDLDGHSSDYRPSFLVNDITRYWKTICLNYEHKRNDRGSAKHKIRNFKLRFSRLLMCYSFLIDLGSHETIDKNTVVAVATRSPAERLRHASRSGRGAPFVERAIGEYEWFIRQVEAPEALQLQLEEEAFRGEAQVHADKFGQALYDILCLSNEKYLRYLVM